MVSLGQFDLVDAQLLRHHLALLSDPTIHQVLLLLPTPNPSS